MRAHRFNKDARSRSPDDSANVVFHLRAISLERKKKKRNRMQLLYKL